MRRRLLACYKAFYNICNNGMCLCVICEGVKFVSALPALVFN